MMSRLAARATTNFLSRTTRVQPFASAASSRLLTILDAEIKHEKDAYKAPPVVTQFLKDSPWKWEHKGGDVNMTLTRKVDGNTVRVDWQLISPFDPNMEEETHETEMMEQTDFSISIENEKQAGLTFYCSTQKGEGHRFVVGNVKSYSSAEERDSMSAYNGPEFEDLEDKLQEAFDEYLGELGLNDAVFDFIDATAADKEQEEYIRWLDTIQKFLA